MASTPNVTFHHPLIPVDLHIYVNPDQVSWAYGLNTASFPTYGGEVVQILSVYIDDMTIAGTVSTYAELEQIYGWFITYMQNATQGRDDPRYNQQPVSFTYAPRGWSFNLWPKSLPGFRYGRDVVAPTWKLVAAVDEPDRGFRDELLTHRLDQLAKGADGIGNFGVVTADFGSTADLVHNPWASPDADPRRKKGETMASYLSQATNHLSDEFAGWVSDYANQQLDKLPEFQPLSKLSGPLAKTPATTQSGKPTHK